MTIWLHAIRPKTLIAGAAPVLLGSALAWADGLFEAWVAALALICSVLIQIASNFINELEDFHRGADVNRVGPLRAVSAGLITPHSMKVASILTVGTAFLLGLPLVAHAGWPVLVIGVVSLVMAWMYTGGPFPLAYHGLGDVFAFVFFGVVAVTGTYFVHATSWSADAFVLSIAPGCLAANILGVNNIRDIPGDRSAGKITLAVRIGGRAARWLYVGLVATALLVPSLALRSHRGPFVMVPLIAAPLAIMVSIVLFRRTGAQLNPVLGMTALLYMIYALAMSAGLVMSAVFTDAWQ